MKQTQAIWDALPMTEVQRAAEAGNTNAQHYLGYCYWQGVRVPQTGAEALTWYRRALSGGYLPAANHLGLMLQEGKVVPKDAAAAVGYYRQGIDGGLTTPMINLGHLYRFGDGVPKNVPEAIRWFARAADAGDSLGVLNLGWVYAYEPAAPIDYERAFSLFLRAANAGQACAMNELYVAYFNGRGVRQDREEAMRWVAKGAEAGCDNAQFALGYRSEYPLNWEPRDMAEAVRWYTRSAEQGNAQAQYYLGRCCLDGEGVAVNEERALEWTRKAADQNHSPALCQLADLYAAGIGEPRNPGESPLHLLEQAANLCEREACQKIVQRYVWGVPIRQDMICAARWYGRAAVKEVPNFELEDPLESRPAGRAGSPPVAFLGMAAPDFAPVLSLYFKAARLPDGTAPMELARACLAGRKVPQSEAQAWLWFTVAARKGAPGAAAEIKRLEAGLPADQLKEVGKLLPPLLADLDSLAATSARRLGNANGN